jgi:hypothetical protein
MIRRSLILLGTLGAMLEPAAAQQRLAQPQPIGSSTVGSWESVAWGVGRRVHFCTLVRVKVPAGQPSYGVLVDRRGILFSIEATAWTLPNAPVDAGIAAVPGHARVLSAMPVSSRRANIDLSRHADLLAEFQKAEQVEVTIAGVTVRLAFDEFNAARVVHEVCVQNIDKDLPRSQNQ